MRDYGHVKQGILFFIYSIYILLKYNTKCYVVCQGQRDWSLTKSPHSEDHLDLLAPEQTGGSGSTQNAIGGR